MGEARKSIRGSTSNGQGLKKTPASSTGKDIELRDHCETKKAGLELGVWGRQADSPRSRCASPWSLLSQGILAHGLNKNLYPQFRRCDACQGKICTFGSQGLQTARASDSPDPNLGPEKLARSAKKSYLTSVRAWFWIPRAHLKRGYHDSLHLYPSVARWNLGLKDPGST